MPKIAKQVVLVIIPARKSFAQGKSSEDASTFKLDSMPQKEKKKSGVKRESREHITFVQDKDIFGRGKIFSAPNRK